MKGLVIALIVVFAVCLTAIIAVLFYVLWRRRRFQRRSTPRGESSVLAGDDTLSSKELLYFLCWKDRCRIEPQESHSVPQPSVSDVDDLLKWQELFGPSRVLFTIREEEEEREGLESSETEAKTKRVCLEDNELAVIVKVEEEEDDDDDDDDGGGGTTPFSTPCDSPPYYTPSPSPARDHELKDSTTEEEEQDHGVVSAGVMLPMSVSLEIYDV